MVPKFRLPKLFLLTVVAPVAASASYYGAMASDVYVSEARFVVRSAEQPYAPGLGGALRSLVSSAGADNAMLVRDYMLSRQSMASVESSLDLREHYKGGDVLSAFPGLLEDDTLERFYEYFAQKVSIHVDSQSSVATITVRSFSPNVAKAINEKLLELAAQRINALNEQIRKDTLGVAIEELERARQRLSEAEKALSRFRRSEGVFDPERQAQLALQGQQELQARLAAAEARLKQSQIIAPQSPSTQALRIEVESLRSALARIGESVVGRSSSRAAEAERYTALALEREVALKTVAAAEEAVVRARAEMNRRHLYLETLSEPSLADSPTLPRRLRNVAATALIGILLWGVLSLLGLGIREHRRGRS